MERGDEHVSSLTTTHDPPPPVAAAAADVDAERAAIVAAAATRGSFEEDGCDEEEHIAALSESFDVAAGVRVHRALVAHTDAAAATARVAMQRYYNTLMLSVVAAHLTEAAAACPTRQLSEHDAAAVEALTLKRTQGAIGPQRHGDALNWAVDDTVRAIASDETHAYTIDAFLAGRRSRAAAADAAADDSACHAADCTALVEVLRASRVAMAHALRQPPQPTSSFKGGAFKGFTPSSRSGYAATRSPQGWWTPAAWWPWRRST